MRRRRIIKGWQDASGREICSPGRVGRRTGQGQGKPRGFASPRMSPAQGWVLVDETGSLIGRYWEFTDRGLINAGSMEAP